MIVIVRLPAALAEHADGRRSVSVDVSPDATVADVIDAVGVQYPAVQRRIVDETGRLRRFVNVYVGYDECRTLGGLMARITSEAEVTVIGSIAGGADPV